MRAAKRPGSAAVRGGLRACALLVCVALIGAVGATAARAAVGAQDASYADAGPAPVSQPSAPTGEKPQSKLWFNDGSWWGSIWAKPAYTIQRYDSSGHFVDTGVAIDPRDKSQADMLWDGTHLYALSAVHAATTTIDPAVRLYRFSYNAATKTYAPDAGFPVVIFQPASAADIETVVLDKDSTGMLWATFTYANDPGHCATPTTCPAGRSVYTAHSTTGDAAWSVPTVIPVPSAADVSGDDISSVVHFGNQIGVLFSDQIAAPGAPATMTGDYFAVHVDGQPDSAWTQETALLGTRAADDHLDLKASPDGRVYAAVKTSANDAGAPVPTDPLIYLLERTTAGVWSSVPFSTVASEETRSQLVLDPTHAAIYQFATFPPDGAYEAGGEIYCKVTSMDAPSFDAGPGVPFIALTAADHLNNISTTKQTVGPDSGLLGIAADDPIRYYAHNSLTLTGTPSCQAAPIGTPAPAPTPVVAPPVPAPPLHPASPPCRLVASSVQVRALSSLMASLRRTSKIRVRVRAACTLRLQLVAALGAAHGATIGRSSVVVQKGKTRTVLVHLTRSGRRLVAHKTHVKVFVITRAPAIKGVRAARVWSTRIRFHG